MSEKPNNGMLGYTQEEYKKFSKNAWIVLLAFSVLYCFLYCGRLNLQYTMPAMMEEEGWTELDLGILSSVLFWTYGIGHLFNGRLGEIFGVNRFIVAGMFLSAAANLLIGFQSSLIVIAVLWGFNGYFQSMLWSPGIALLSRWWPGEKRGFATGFANAFSGFGQVFAALTVSGVYHHAKQRLESGIYRTGCHYGYFRHYLYFPGKRQPEKDWSERIRGPGRETP